MRDLTGGGSVASSSWKGGAHVVDGHARGRYRNAQMAGAREKDAFAVRVFLRLGRAAARMAGLGNQLVHDAVKLLPREEVIVAAEHERDVVLNEYLMDGLAPAGTSFVEAPRAVGMSDARESRCLGTLECR